MWPNPQFPAHLVTFTEEIINGKLHVLSSEKYLPNVDSKWNLRIFLMLMKNGIVNERYSLIVLSEHR